MPCFQMTTKDDQLTIREWIKMSKNVQVLSCDRDTKTIAIGGEIEEGEDDNKTIKLGIVVLEKTPFEFDEAANLLNGDEQHFRIDFINNIYRHCTVTDSLLCNSMFILTVRSTNCDLHLLKILN